MESGGKSMKNFIMKNEKFKNSLILIFTLILFFTGILYANQYNRIVSVDPTSTQLLFALGVGDKVVGVTYHDTYPFEATQKTIVGGFFAPDISRIEKLNPDIIFCAKFHKKIIKHFKNKAKIITLEAHSVKDIYKNINFLGNMFGKEKKAGELIKKMKNEILLIEKKVQLIPKSKRKKVVRIMGRGFVPGKGSFQIDVIRKAGGIPFVPRSSGEIYKISLDEWEKFNPDIIYVCGNDKNYLKDFFDQSGWKDVTAVKKHKILTFPCILTCRPSELTGYFIQWLGASIYGDEFFKKENIFTKSKILEKEKLEKDFDYIKNVGLVTGIINDFHHKTLLIEFKKNQRILSTLDGFRNVKFVGNHYLVPPRWNEGHKDFKSFKKNVADALNISLKNSSLLYTGANMDNLAEGKAGFKDIKIEVFTTAGVMSNAMRSSKDKGMYINHGTINIIVLTNLHLTDRAMTRSIIAITEAKTAALQDLDIRSSYQRLKYQATGTGTDNIIIVSGNDRKKDIAGGHSKFAEILTKLVYESVKEAILKQNRIVANRNIFQRFKERNIRLFELSKIAAKYNKKSYSYNMEKLQNILLTQKYANFLKSCMAISDDYEAGLIDNTDFIDDEVNDFVQKLGGKHFINFKETNYPFILDKCIDGIISSVY